jgi:hypothetical protein
VPVIAVRLRYDLHNAEADATPARFVLDWLAPQQGGYDELSRSSNWNLPTGDDRTTTVYLLDMVQELRIQPDNRPGIFRIHSLEILVPDTPPPTARERPRGGGRSRESGSGTDASSGPPVSPAGPSTTVK